jgi:hypothetical protein
VRASAGHTDFDKARDDRGLCCFSFSKNRLKAWLQRSSAEFEEA